MARNPYPAAWATGKRAHVQDYPVAAASTYLTGALVLLDANEELIECSADPAVVLGVAEGPAAPTNNPRPLNAAGLRQGGVYLADGDTLFAVWGNTTPTEDNLDQPYGVIKVGNLWLLDFTETTADVFKVVRIIQQGSDIFTLSRFVPGVRQMV